MSATSGSGEGPNLPAVLTGRITVDTSAHGMSFGNAPLMVIPPPQPHQQWRAMELDSLTLSRVNVVRLIELLADTSPEVGRAIDDAMRMLNPGFEYRAYKPGREDADDEEPRARAIIDGIFTRLRRRHGAVDVTLNRWFMGLLIRGAWFGEAVVGKDRRTVLDLATPDPASVRFRKIVEEELGEVHQLGQWQRSEFVSLDYPTIRYVPYDPFPASPYGRSPLNPGIFGAIFLLGFLQDIRRVIAQQGYPRIHISINLKRLVESIPAQDRQDWRKIEQYGNQLMARVQREYARLRPEDAYVHSDVIEINRPVGTLDASSLGMIEQVIGVLERMLVRALKSTPLMFGLTDGTSEANANRQWELAAQRIKQIQHLCESPLEDLLEYACQIDGVLAAVKFRFAELRSAELLRDAQTEWQQIRNAREKYNAGWIDNDEASNDVTGHDAAEDEPRESSLGTTPQVADPEPGQARGIPAALRGIPEAARLFGSLLADDDDTEFAAWCDRRRVRGIVTEQELAYISRARNYFRAQRADPKVEPTGGGSFDDLPSGVSYGDDDRDDARAAWDSAIPAYAGLLSAEVEGEEPTDEEIEEIPDE